ncbi:MAG: hypothetical protein FJ271_32020 [Planctomycetes bacterium]|nr:hypothetical protein [Planctomycetota bacterium]
MPLKLNIGLSKKVGESNYGSRGASLNVEIELESALIAEPAKFQERVRQVFALVRTSLDEELNGNGHAPSTDNGNGKTQQPVNGNGNGPARNGGQRQATQSQIKAIHAIARSRRIDIGQFLSDRFHVNRADDLNIKAASTAIDELKGDAKAGRAA